MDRTMRPCAKRMRGGTRGSGWCCNLHHGCLTGILTTYKNEDFNGPYSWWECWWTHFRCTSLLLCIDESDALSNPLSSESSCWVSPDSQPFPDCSGPPAYSLRFSSIPLGPFQYGPNLLCLPHLFFFCPFYPAAQSGSITTHPLPCLPGRVLHASHRLAAGLLQNIFTLEPKLLPKHCHAGDGKCEQGWAAHTPKAVPRGTRHHFCASALFECPESTRHLFPGKAQQYTPGSKPLKSFVGGKKKLNRLETVVASAFKFTNKILQVTYLHGYQQQHWVKIEMFLFKRYPKHEDGFCFLKTVYFLTPK